MELPQQPAYQPASKRQRIGTEPGRKRINAKAFSTHCKHDSLILVKESLKVTLNNGFTFYALFKYTVNLEVVKRNKIF
jgi:hypothetical protein